jgi:hypothetical protein
MNPIPIAAYRRKTLSADRVREGRSGTRIPRVVFRAEAFPGEPVLADLAVVGDDPTAAGRILARYAAVRALQTGRTLVAIEQALSTWSPLISGTEEGRALSAALQAPAGSRRAYRALMVAAREAAFFRQYGGAFALRRLAFELARAAGHRACAARAASHVARAAAGAGAYAAALRWDRRATRLRAAGPPA